MTARVERNVKRAAPPPRVGFVSLGCPKALVDSEQILTQLRAEGYAISPTYDGADLVVVNTCGFIDAAIGESLDAIGEALAENGKVIVTGCLGAKQGGDFVREAHPQVLAVTGPHATAGSDERGAPAPAEAARPLRRPRATARDQADADALRLSQDQRRLQSPLHVLHHPVDARRSRQPADRRGAARGGAAAEGGRQGAAGRVAGHERVRRRRALPYRLLARTPRQDPDERARARARRSGARARRVGAAALRLPVPARRRRYPADGRRRRRARASRVSRRAVPAREPAHPQADEASRCAGEGTRSADRMAARAARSHRAQHVHRWLSRRDRRRIRRTARFPRRGESRPRRLLRVFAGRWRGSECAARPGSRRRR